MVYVLPSKGILRKEERLFDILEKDHLRKYIQSFKGYTRRALVSKTNILIQS
jgi:hypothetical protein